MTQFEFLLVVEGSLLVAAAWAQAYMQWLAILEARRGNRLTEALIHQNRRAP